MNCWTFQRAPWSQSVALPMNCWAFQWDSWSQPASSAPAAHNPQREGSTTLPDSSTVHPPSCPSPSAGGSLASCRPIQLAVVVVKGDACLQMWTFSDVEGHGLWTLHWFLHCGCAPSKARLPQLAPSCWPRWVGLARNQVCWVCAHLHLHHRWTLDE